MTDLTHAADLSDWEADNGDYLAAALGWVRSSLADEPAVEFWTDPRWAGSPTPPALELLGHHLALSRFELLTLLLAASFDLDPDAWSDGARGHDRQPTFGIAMRLVDDPAWDVVSVQRPLRYWRLVEIDQAHGQALVNAPLRAAERIVDYLKGLNHLDDRLEHVVRPVGDVLGAPLPPSQEATVEQALAAWLEPPDPGLPVIIELLGADDDVLRGVAAVIAERTGSTLHEVVPDLLPAGSDVAAEWARLWEREGRLAPVVLYADLHDLDPGRAQSVSAWLSGIDAPIIIGCREPATVARRSVRLIDARRPTAPEQEQLWRAALTDGGDAVVPDAVTPADASPIASTLSARLDVSQVTIRRTAHSVRRSGGGLDQLWTTCQAHTRPRLESLAQRVDAHATWDDLVLPEREQLLLRHLVDQVRGHTTVLRDWGFADHITRGSGVTALFAGQSGTGKTFAAEVIAAELGLALYRVDLAGVVSKYIGETERNLRQVFDAADEGGALLLFDEADALFGKRSDVKDSHDRYANIEVNYLLQRMEDYRGVAILTTNQRHALDQAFLRRLRFVVSFPFPSSAERSALWERAFPDKTPVDDLDVERLATLAATGGMIRNIALNAAFVAAGQGTAVTTRLVLDMARVEFDKLEMPVNDQDFRWIDRVTG